MIKRYQSERLRQLWSLENRYQTFLKVELASIKALYERGIITLDTYEKLLKVTYTLEDIEANEVVLKHDVLAFTEACQTHLGIEKTYFHFGLTSTDVVDTAISLLIKEVEDVLTSHMNTLLKTIVTHANAHKKTLMMARTHGMYAEVNTWGIRMLRLHEDLTRAFNEVLNASKALTVIKLSGAVGTYSILPIEHETMVANYLNLNPQLLSTQVLARDRHARYISSLAVLSSVIEDFVLDIRLLSRSDVLEVSEGFTKGQKGSSAMPHKKNPIISENLTGLARMMRGYVTMVFENIALWHERDISHSSVERVVLEDATSLMEHSIVKLNALIEGLYINESTMRRHIDETYGTHLTQRYLHYAILKGYDRKETYEHLQSLSFQSMESNTELIALIQQHPFFQSISKALSTQFGVDTQAERLEDLYEHLKAQLTKIVL